MIEPIMYFGIGFLVAALIGLVVVPLVHGRAVRLTMRRLEAAAPLSMAEIQADKDQLRAEFAMSTRRLEMSVDQLKTKSTSQLAELGKKGDAINRLKIEPVDGFIDYLVQFVIGRLADHLDRHRIVADTSGPFAARQKLNGVNDLVDELG